MAQNIEVKIVEAHTSLSLQGKAEQVVRDGWRPIGGPFVYGEMVSWAFIRIPEPPPREPQPEPTREEIIRAATEGKTIVREA